MGENYLPNRLFLSGLNGMNNPSENKRLADAVANIAATMVEIINEKLKAATTMQPGSVPWVATRTATVPEGWVRKKELAQHLKVSLRTVDNLMGKGIVPYIRLGSRKVLFKLNEVDESLNRRYKRNGLR